MCHSCEIKNDEIGRLEEKCEALQQKLYEAEDKLKLEQAVAGACRNACEHTDKLLQEAKARTAALEQELAEEKRWRMEKDETATVFMNQVKKLQEQLSTEQKKREEAEQDLKSVTDFGKRVAGQLQHRLEQAELKNAELREALESCVYSMKAGSCGPDLLMLWNKAATSAQQALCSTPDAGQWVRKEDKPKAKTELDEGFGGQFP